MFTLLLAWLNAKYRWDYEFLFLGTVFFDFVIIVFILVQIDAYLGLT